MKKTLLCLLLSAGTIFGSTSALLAGNPADATPAPAPADTVAVAVQADTLAVPAEPAAIAAQTKTDSLLQVLGDRLSDVEQSINQVRHMSYPRYGFFNSENVTIVFVVALISAAVVLMTFFALKYRYRRQEKKYELERMRIERGEQLPVHPWNEMPVTLFIRRLLVIGIVAFGILAWVGVANLGYMRFFASLLLWALIAGVGYAVVHLFRVYVQRRDENR